MIPHLSLIFWLLALIFFGFGMGSRWFANPGNWPHSFVSAGLFCCVLASLIEGKIG